MLGFEHSSLIHVLRAISVYVNEAENWHGVPFDSSHICGFDVQARPKVDDKDGGSYTGEWLGAAMVSTPADNSEAKKLLAMIPGCWRHGKGIQARVFDGLRLYNSYRLYFWVNYQIWREFTNLRNPEIGRGWIQELTPMLIR